GAGWGYHDLFPYFRRSEDNALGASQYHGAGGPLPLQDLRHKSEHARLFIEAAVRRGAVANDDFNGAQQEGVGFYQVTQRDGARCTVADAYLASRPANLTVVTDALVTGLILEGGRAAGVTYRRQGRDETARAEAEVILAAGAIGTPHLLMLSGIGPADHLREHGIYVIADMPAVGANLIDHPAVPVLWSTPSVKGLWESTRNRDFARWRMTHKGPLASNVAEAGGFARSDPRLSAPDLQWHVLPVAYREQGLADPARRAMTVLVTLVDTASRGRVKLASRDPRHRPLIDPDYLSDVRDLNALAVGVRMARDYGTAAPLSKICAEELTPGDGTHTDHEVRDFIRRTVVTAYQPAGTCALGGDVARSASGYDSVVDPQLRVRGISGLRVVDASVMPTLPRGDIGAAVVAIAERAADLSAGLASARGSWVLRLWALRLWPALRPGPRPRVGLVGGLRARGVPVRLAAPFLRLVQAAVQHRDQLDDPVHVGGRALEGGGPHHRLHPLPGDRLGPGELAQPVGPVDPPEPGLAGPPEGQRGHRRVRDHRVHRRHPGAQRPRGPQAGLALLGEHRRAERVRRRVGEPHGVAQRGDRRARHARPEGLLALRGALLRHVDQDHRGDVGG